jgi:GT2 family glycosyltransferase
MPLISIITPAFNRAHLIGETIKSVLRQTFTDWELIVVDDGSTDDTGAVVSRFNDARIRCLRQARAGATAARNHGLSQARGELILFLDSDDVMLPHSLGTLCATLAAHPEAGCAYGWAYFMDVHGEPLPYAFGDIDCPIPPQLDQPWPGRMPPLCGTCEEGRILPHLLHHPECTILIGAFLVQRAWVERVGGFNPLRGQYQEHWDFQIQLARAGCLHVCCRQGVMVCRDHAEGAHHDVARMLESGLTLLDELCAEAQKDPALRAEIAPHYPSSRKQLYLWASKNAFDAGQTGLGAQYLNSAHACHPVQARDAQNMAAALVRGALLFHGADAAGEIDRVRAALDSPALAQKVTQPARALLDFQLAFRAHAAQQRRHTLVHAARAAMQNPPFLANRGLMKIALISLLPRKLACRLFAP